jgi:hypothetical protein
LALANQTVQETFEQSCVAWQAIPHWDTGDPGQARVPNDIVNNPGFLPLVLKKQDFQVTVLQANAPTPDPLLTEVMFYTAKLAGIVDDDVIPDLYAADTTPTQTNWPRATNTLVAIERRRERGYRAPSCLLTNAAGLRELSQLVSGCSILQQLLSRRTSIRYTGPTSSTGKHENPTCDTRSAATDRPRIRRGGVAG